MGRSVKLAFVHRRYGVDGGTERFLESLTRRLGQRGHEVDVWASSVDPRFARTKVATFRRLPGGGGFAGSALLWLFAAMRVRRADYEGVVHMGRTGPLDVYRAGGGCHRTWFELLLAKAESGWARFRLKASPGHLLRLRHERRALRRGGQFVVPSERARQDLIAAYGAEAEHVRVLHNGVDLDRFHPKGRQLFFEEIRASLGLPPEEMVLLFVGSDWWRKGLDTVFRAVAQLDEREELRILVLGDDKRRADFEALAQQLGLRDRVSFVSLHPWPEKVYAACDVMVLPTRHDPFANVTLEALAAGLPVVTSRTNGAVEAIRENPALSIVDDPNDADGFAEALRGQLRTEGIQERRAAAREAAAECGEGAAVDRWEAFLGEVAGARNLG